MTFQLPGTSTAGRGSPDRAVADRAIPHHRTTARPLPFSASPPVLETAPWTAKSRCFSGFTPKFSAF